MAAFERVDPNGDLHTGRSVFYLSDTFGNQVEFSQQEAQELMGWLRSSLDPLPSLSEQRERERAIMEELAALPLPITITGEHDERGKQFYRWIAGRPGTPQPWGIAVGTATAFHDAVENALVQALKYAMKAKESLT
jgi:hypothetical protein